MSPGPEVLRAQTGRGGGHGGMGDPFAQSHLIRPTVRTSTHTFCATIFWGARSGRRGTPPYISPVSRREPHPCEPVLHMGQSGQGGRRAEANQDGGNGRRAWRPRYIEARQQRSCTTSAHTTEAHKRTTALTSILLGTSPAPRWPTRSVRARSRATAAVRCGLWIVLLENPPALPHPWPPTVWVDRGVGLELPATSRKFDNETGDVACVLQVQIGCICEIAHGEMTDAQTAGVEHGILTSMPLCGRPSNGSSPSACSWRGMESVTRRGRGNAPDCG